LASAGSVLIGAGLIWWAARRPLSDPDSARAGLSKAA